MTDAIASRPLEGRAPGWRRDALRTTFWVVPVILIIASSLLFALTFGLDVAAFHHDFRLPSLIVNGNADAGRQILIAIAAAIITTIGVVFSITILALTLASQQFGPRMMRNFVRDTGNQLTLGIFVASFVYSVLALGSIGSVGGGFVPYLSIAVAEGLLFVDLAVLIYFIHHIAKSIQLPEVIAGIARDLLAAVNAEFPDSVKPGQPSRAAGDLTAVLARIGSDGAPVNATASGYLQFVGYRQLIEIAENLDAVIQLTHQPGHYLIEGHTLALVHPASAAPSVERALARTHVVGHHRTLIQDPVFAIDQMVEIAIRALSPAVNDTFTALTCIDWLSAGLSAVTGRQLTEGVYRGRSGDVRLIEPEPRYARMVNRAFDKVRQAASGMPAVIIRLLDALAHVAECTVSDVQRSVLARQADMILRLAESTIPEQNDLADIRSRHATFVATCEARARLSA